MQALGDAKSVEGVTSAHTRFVDAVQRQCLLAPDKTWKLIEGVVMQILNQVLHFAELQQKLRKPVSLWAEHMCCALLCSAVPCCARLSSALLCCFCAVLSLDGFCICEQSKP